MNKHIGLHKRKLGYSLLEFLVVMVVISLLIYAGFEVYIKQIESSREKALAFQASTFMRMVSNIHAYGVGANQDAVHLLKRTVYLNKNGYPANTTKNLSASTRNQTAEECGQLWRAFFQTLEKYNEHQNEVENLSISVKNNDFCRYDLYPQDADTYFFDYYYKTGEVLVGRPGTNNK